MSPNEGLDPYGGLVAGLVEVYEPPHFIELAVYLSDHRVQVDAILPLEAPLLQLVKPHHFLFMFSPLFKSPIIVLTLSLIMLHLLR